MPRRQREVTPPAPSPSRSIVASSVRYESKTPRIYNENDRGWQRECYRHYRICGEARFAAQFFGHALSKVVLYAVDDPYNPKAEKLSSGPAVDTLHELFNGSEGQAAMLAALGTHLTIAGECYLIGRTIGGDDVWEIRSVLEVKSNGIRGPGAKWSIANDSGQGYTELKDSDAVIRIWIPDPETAAAADSPFRSLLPILQEIEWLTKYVFAQCTSRLGGAGVWLVSEEIEFPPPPDAADNPDRSKADSLMQMLADAILKPIEDPSNPAAKVPVIATVPGEQIANVKDGWLTFWTELDSEAKVLREEAIKRFALGMDLPPERVLGMSSNSGTGGGTSNGVSHWGAWQVDEDTVKLHIEPMAEVIVQALTIDYLRPVTQGVEAVRYDTTNLRLRPDRSQESLELWDRGLVKAEIVLKENGFDPKTEGMDDTEKKLWLLWKIASGSATPDMVIAAIQQVGIDLPVAPPAMPMMPGLPEVPNESRPAPSLMEHPERALPERPAAALLAAAEGLVYRALERAGNRIRQSGVKPPGIRSFEVHTATTLTPGQAIETLGDAWSCAPMVLDGLTDDSEAVTKSLNSYVVGLLTSSQPHTRDALAKWMATCA